MGLIRFHKLLLPGTYVMSNRNVPGSLSPVYTRHLTGFYLGSHNIFTQFLHGFYPVPQNTSTQNTVLLYYYIYYIILLYHTYYSITVLFVFRVKD